MAKVRSMFGQVEMVVDQEIHVLVMVTLIPYIQYIFKKKLK